jgi:hypothetical protein
MTNAVGGDRFVRSTAGWHAVLPATQKKSTEVFE